MIVLSIGTTHPWNTSGVGLDLQVGTELGVHVCSIVTAVAAQGTRGVTSIETIPTANVRKQLETVERDDIAAIRVGALTSLENVGLIAETLRTHRRIPAVVDPVMSATLGGTAFASEATVQAMRERIATLPNVILTPNLREAAILLGIEELDRDAIGSAATTLQRLGSRAVLVKGGHLRGNPVDALATAEHIEMFGGDRLEHDMRGTGCVLAMSLAFYLARGDDLRVAVQHARAFVRKKIKGARQFGDLRVAY